MWQKDDDNVTHNWFEAAGQSDPTYNPGGATDVCGNLALAGYPDWRLPTSVEIMSLVKWEVADPAIDLAYFPSTKSSYYWASTVSAAFPTSAFVANFIIGHNNGGANMAEPMYVRCVRGALLTFGMFNDNGDGTVSDFSTDYMWQQASSPIMTWNDANGYCNGLSLGGYDDWRMPEIWELGTIVDYSTHSPAIDTLFFPETYNTYYHAKTCHYSGCSYAHLNVYFTWGTVNSGPDSGYVRCVRDE